MGNRTRLVALRTVPAFYDSIFVTEFLHGATLRFHLFNNAVLNTASTCIVIYAVLDTNVILAALLSRRGAAFEILTRLRRGEWRLVLGNHLLLEYEEVSKRNAATLDLTHEEVDRFLNAICQAADCFQLLAAQPPRLPDADDEPLLRLAEASGARLITTHNLRHLRAASAHGITVLPPREFLRILSAPP